MSNFKELKGKVNSLKNLKESFKLEFIIRMENFNPGKISIGEERYLLFLLGLKRLQL